jgi:solute carrier family 35 protein E1
VGALFAACVSLSLLSDTLTKKILQQDRSLTVTVTFFHFAMSALGGTVVVPVLAWLARSKPAIGEEPVELPPLSLRDWGVLVPLVCCQALGFLFTNLSLKFVAVSFSHTVKACECLFTALLAYSLLGQVVSLPKYLSLLPVAAGVALSSATELQFSTAGFGAAMMSNLLFASRSVLSSRLFQRRKASASTLYWIMCCGALACLMPLFVSQINFASLVPFATTAPLASLAMCGFAHFGYNMLSFMILQRTSPITHVILHAVRRILVIGVSSAMLRNRITVLNWAGIVVAFAGVLGYSLSP